VPVCIIPKSCLKCCLCYVKDGTQDDILWDDREQSGEGSSYLEYENATGGSLGKLSD
jgi:hypothetical protein